MAWSPVRVAVVGVQVSAMKRRRVMDLSLFGGGGGWGGRWCGTGVGVGDNFAAAADKDLLFALVVEVDIEHGGAGMIPDGRGDGEVEEVNALGRPGGAGHV